MVMDFAFYMAFSGWIVIAIILIIIFIRIIKGKKILDTFVFILITYSLTSFGWGFIILLITKELSNIFGFD
jgi:hypothetical protein